MQTEDPDKAREKARKEAAIINRWLVEQRGSRSYRAAPKAGAAISKIMRPLSAKFGAGRSGLTDHWESIVGKRFAKISRPVRFLGGRDGRTLLISAPGPAAALISAAGSSIIDKANSYLGPGYIRHIKVVQSSMRDGQLSGSKAKKTLDLTPAQKEELHTSLENVTDPDLKKALEKLGRHAISRPK